jgi:hypothetical protein
MKRCLAYGMFPGFFSANASDKQYFSQPALYNRDRDLFRKYVPLCRRVAEAGWRPITGALSSDPQVHLERFGDKYLTLLNDGPTARTVTVTLLGTASRLKSCRELVDSRDVPIEEGKLTLSLAGEGVAVVQLP